MNYKNIFSILIFFTFGCNKFAKNNVKISVFKSIDNSQVLYKISENGITPKLKSKVFTIFGTFIISPNSDSFKYLRHYTQKPKNNNTKHKDHNHLSPSKKHHNKKLNDKNKNNNKSIHNKSNKQKQLNINKQILNTTRVLYLNDDTKRNNIFEFLNASLKTDAKKYIDHEFSNKNSDEKTDQEDPFNKISQFFNLTHDENRLYNKKIKEFKSLEDLKEFKFDGKTYYVTDKILNQLNSKINETKKLYNLDNPLFYRPLIYSIIKTHLEDLKSHLNIRKTNLIPILSYYEKYVELLQTYNSIYNQCKNFENCLFKIHPKSIVNIYTDLNDKLTKYNNDFGIYLRFNGILNSITNNPIDFWKKYYNHFTLEKFKNFVNKYINEKREYHFENSIKYYKDNFRKLLIFLNNNQDKDIKKFTKLLRSKYKNMTNKAKCDTKVFMLEHAPLKLLKNYSLKFNKKLKNLSTKFEDLIYINIDSFHFPEIFELNNIYDNFVTKFKLNTGIISEIKYPCEIFKFNPQDIPKLIFNDFNDIGFNDSINHKSQIYKLQLKKINIISKQLTQITKSLSFLKKYFINDINLDKELIQQYHDLKIPIENSFQITYTYPIQNPTKQIYKALGFNASNTIVSYPLRYRNYNISANIVKINMDHMINWALPHIIKFFEIIPFDSLTHKIDENEITTLIKNAFPPNEDQKEGQDIQDEIYKKSEAIHSRIIINHLITKKIILKEYDQIIKTIGLNKICRYNSYDCGFASIKVNAYPVFNNILITKEFDICTKSTLVELKHYYEPKFNQLFFHVLYASYYNLNLFYSYVDDLKKNNKLKNVIQDFINVYEVIKSKYNNEKIYKDFFINSLHIIYGVDTDNKKINHQIKFTIPLNIKKDKNLWYFDQLTAYKKKLKK